ncbi:hypothetical protein GGR56DRAFT_79762 [Xylariaceae sp. FL0804]|nr:hypothetical protein GGR56DRAFT_79762 [Xylariaceae sp. FL0804]
MCVTSYPYALLSTPRRWPSDVWGRLAWLCRSRICSTRHGPIFRRLGIAASEQQRALSLCVWHVGSSLKKRVGAAVSPRVILPGRTPSRPTAVKYRLRSQKQRWDCYPPPQSTDNHPRSRGRGTSCRSESWVGSCMPTCGAVRSASPAIVLFMFGSAQRERESELRESELSGC